MQKLIPFLILSLILITNISVTAADTTTISTLQIGKFGGDVRSIQFVNASTGYVVGDDLSNTNFNFIGKTTNGGASWFRLNVPQLNRRPNAVEFINVNTGFVAGSNGLMLRTTNAGSTWDSISVAPYAAELNDVEFIGSDTGYACGINTTAAPGTILKTVNGGLTWTINTVIRSTREAIYAYSNQLVITVGASGVVTRTTNGGATWDSLRFGTLALYSIDAVGFSKMYMTGSSQVVYVSTDRGANFTLAFDNGASPLYEVDFVDSLRGVIVGSNGVNYRTTNGGTTWDSTDVSQFSAQVLFTCLYKSPTEIFAAGGQGNILRSTNSGVSYDYVESSTRIHSIDFADANNGVAVGWRGTVLKTTNGGVNWSYIKAIQGFELYDVKTFSSNVFYACGGNGQFYKTTDGGNTFSNTSIGTTANTLKTMWWFNQNEGYVCGFDGNVAYTTNAGASFTTQYSFGTANNDIEDIFFINNTTGYVTGQLGKLAKTTDRLTWDSSGIDGPVNSTIWEMSWTSANTGYAGSLHGCIYKTTNGAVSWTLQNDTTGLRNLDVIDIEVLNDTSRGYAVSEGGKLYSLVNANSWKTYTTYINPFNGSETDLWGLDFVTNTPATASGFICGYEGALLKINVTPMTDLTVNNSLVNDYNLKQNYPNPFNPSTTISFDLPKDDFVKIKIYDLTGRLISTLINTQLNKGSYSVNFNAGNLSSGVYFYILETTDFKDTKQMLLLK